MTWPRTPRQDRINQNVVVGQVSPIHIQALGLRLKLRAVLVGRPDFCPLRKDQGARPTEPVCPAGPELMSELRGGS